jgi:hypothetical protein
MFWYKQQMQRVFKRLEMNASLKSPNGREII